jgi:hypothetical protein
MMQRASLYSFFVAAHYATNPSVPEKGADGADFWGRRICTTVLRTNFTTSGWKNDHG